MYVSEEKARSAEAVFMAHGGTLRTSQAVELGVHPRTLYQMRDEGRLLEISRGVYRLAKLPPLSNPDLLTVATRIPDAVVCLISALSFHEITSEIPHEVHIALSRSMRRPTLQYPPIRTYRFSQQAFTAGVENHELDGVSVRVYGPSKTVADCIKFRNRIGQDVAMEALRLSLERSKTRPEQLLRYARICRVESLMKTYIEALS